MKNYEEIKDIIVNQLGLKTLEDYRKYLNQFWVEHRMITQADIDLLSPDNINNNDFWKVTEELFSTDPICNRQGSDYNTPQPLASIMESNRENIALARATGMLNIVDLWKHMKINILEIGAGYGNLRNYVETTTYYNYTGVDVNPTLKYIIKNPSSGLLSDDVKNKKYGIIYSSNVFQHLSKQQRSTYFKDVSELLEDYGAFVFNLGVCYSENKNSFDGKYYGIHYGQFTEVPLHIELLNELLIYFSLTYECRRNDGLTTFTLSKKQINANIPVK